MTPEIKAAHKKLWRLTKKYYHQRYNQGLKRKERGPATIEWLKSCRDTAHEVLSIVSILEMFDTDWDHEKYVAKDELIGSRIKNKHKALFTATSPINETMFNG